MRAELLQVAGEIVRDMRDGELSGLSAGTKAYSRRMAEIMETHLLLDARDRARAETTACIERLTLDLRQMTSRLRKSELCLTEARRWLAEFGADRGNGD